MFRRHQAVLEGKTNQVGASVKRKFFENVHSVSLNRLLAHVQACRRFGVGMAEGEQFDDLPLARGQQFHNISHFIYDDDPEAVSGKVLILMGTEKDATGCFLA